MVSARTSTTALVTLAALLACAQPLAAENSTTPPSPAAKTRPVTLQERLEEAGRWVVALRVEREKDIEPPRGQRRARAISRHVRDYYRRPAGPVSGILLDPQGHILTSFYNVAGDLRSIHVLLPGGEERRATRLAVAEVDDLALLRVEGDEPAASPEGWTSPPWADGPPRAGQIVLALGRAPDSRGLTVTQGIVSAVARNGYRAIQTDAKLNYGNSGGPLIDLAGRFVAVATFVGHAHPQWGLNSGVGFGTTAATVREVLPEMRRGQNVRQPDGGLLGVFPDTERLHVVGAPVARVVANSPAASAGMKDGDLIVSFEERPVSSFNHLRGLVYPLPGGTSVRLKVKRGDEALDLTVVLGKRSEAQQPR